LPVSGVSWLDLHFGFRECTVEDAEALQAWLAENVATADPRQQVVRDQMLDRCRKWRVEPPTKGRIERIVRAAVHGAQTALCERIAGRPSAETISRIEQLLAVDVDYEDDEARDVLALVKAAPGNVSLDTMLTEIGVPLRNVARAAKSGSREDRYRSRSRRGWARTLCARRRSRFAWLSSSPPW
jgi:hypothetical protein